MGWAERTAVSQEMLRALCFVVTMTLPPLAVGVSLGHAINGYAPQELARVLGAARHEPRQKVSGSEKTLANLREAAADGLGRRCPWHRKTARSSCAAASSQTSEGAQL